MAEAEMSFLNQDWCILQNSLSLRSCPNTWHKQLSRTLGNPTQLMKWILATIQPSPCPLQKEWLIDTCSSGSTSLTLPLPKSAPKQLLHSNSWVVHHAGVHAQISSPTKPCLVEWPCSSTVQILYACRERDRSWPFVPIFHIVLRNRVICGLINK